MGIPGLYRWLVDRYPYTLCCVAEERSRFSHGPPSDTTTPNPNGVEFDNLYIDMNGVIHPCFHPEGLPAPQSYDAVLRSIVRYIDRVFSIVRPRKLLFLAVDGVAPRAKMNHQRKRRFMASREAAAGAGQAAVEVEGIEDDKKLDSNVITPGTEFMDLLSSALQYYVHLRMNSDPAWRAIKVVVSDSTVVGEGEHKILSYIRSQRSLPGYDPNTRHCFHGLDADLIMLALATHEIHVSILRQVIAYGKYTKLDSNENYSGTMKDYIDHLKFEFFNIWVLREYLEEELLRNPKVQGADFERLIDDFVFICLFVGNDFLPHLPSLDIAEGGVELLMIVYQEEFGKMGYLTDSSKVNLKSMEHFLQALSIHETATFKKRAQDMHKRKRMVSEVSVSDVEMRNNHRKPKYYTSKFDCESHDVDRIKRDAVLRYTEGVCWIMHYYYQGVCSWQWFYPYHYAPFASDFCGLDELQIHFTLGQPLKPLDQLLAVLPAASAHALPLSYRELMTNKSSPILDFYPRDAKIDRNGKKHAWQGVCKLPFIEESRLLSETVKLEHTLMAEEKQRNRFGRDRLFVHDAGHPLSRLIENHPHLTAELEIQIDPGLSGGMNGSLLISDKPVCPSRIPSPVSHKHIEENCVKSVDYKCPCDAPHVPKLLSGVIMPPKILRSQDIPPPPLIWHASSATLAPQQHGSKSEPQSRDVLDLAQQPGAANAHALSSTSISMDMDHGQGSLKVAGEEPEKQNHGSESLRKKHKKTRVVKVEGEDDKEQEKMIEEKTRDKMESHVIPALVEEGAMSQKVIVEAGTNGQQKMKRKKQKTTKSGLGVDDFQIGEKTNNNKEQQLGDVNGVDDFQIGEKKKKKKVEEIVDDFQIGEKKKKKKNKEQEIVDDFQIDEKKKKKKKEQEIVDDFQIGEKKKKKKKKKVQEIVEEETGEEVNESKQKKT